MDSTAQFMWLLLQKTGQTVPEGSDGVQKPSLCCTGLSSLELLNPRRRCHTAPPARAVVGQQGCQCQHCLREGFQCCDFQAGDTSLFQSILVPLPLHREWWEGEGAELLCGVAVTGSSTALLVLALLLLMAFALRGFGGNVEVCAGIGQYPGRRLFSSIWTGKFRKEKLNFVKRDSRKIVQVYQSPGHMFWDLQSLPNV